MKKLLTVIILTIMISGCSTASLMMDVADIFIDDRPVHHAVVESVIKGEDKTTIIFIDGVGYEVEERYISVERGDMVKIFKDEDGSYRAEVE